MTTLKQGSRGAEVKTLQSLLKVTSDGIFGQKTKAAVIAFQKANGLVADGIVGKKTWAKLLTAKKPESPHFKLSEFRCKDGTEVPQMYYSNCQKLMGLLEEIRFKCGNKPITINSGYRTAVYNRKCGGANNSQHLYAAAADITVAGVAPSKVYAICNTLVGSRGGVGKYNTFTHVDVRGYKARW